MERRRYVWHGAAMAQRSSLAGGVFLTLAIIGGTIVGIAYGNPMKGVLGGTLVGAAGALLTWLIDRRRARRAESLFKQS